MKTLWLDSLDLRSVSYMTKEPMIRTALCGLHRATDALLTVSGIGNQVVDHTLLIVKTLIESSETCLRNTRLVGRCISPPTELWRMDPHACHAHHTDKQQHCLTVSARDCVIWTGAWLQDDTRYRCGQPVDARVALFRTGWPGRTPALENAGAQGERSRLCALVTQARGRRSKLWPPPCSRRLAGRTSVSLPRLPFAICETSNGSGRTLAGCSHGLRENSAASPERSVHASASSPCPSSTSRQALLTLESTPRANADALYPQTEACPVHTRTILRPPTS